MLEPLDPAALKKYWGFWEQRQWPLGREAWKMACLSMTLMLMTLSKKRQNKNMQHEMDRVLKYVEQRKLGEIVCECMSRVCVSLIGFWLQAHNVCHSNGQDLAQAMCLYPLSRFGLP